MYSATGHVFLHPWEDWRRDVGVEERFAGGLTLIIRAGFAQGLIFSKNCLNRSATIEGLLIGYQNIVLASLSALKHPLQILRSVESSIPDYKFNKLITKYKAHRTFS